MYNGFSYIGGVLAVLAWLATAVAQEPPVLVGAVVSQTGSQAALATGYLKGLVLWQEQANAAGGILGRRVELRLRDDHSEAARAGPAYAELIAGGAELLVGPYGSAATLVAAAEAERAQRVMANAGGPSARIYKRPRRYVFQTIAPYSAYAEGVVAVARQGGARKLYVLARNDSASVEMGDAARELALKMGFSASQLTVYSSTDDLSLLVPPAAVQEIDAWIAFGQARDAAEMVIAMKRAGYAPGLFYARGAAEPEFITRVGQDAEFSLGSLAYDPALPTPYNAGFVKAYAARWGRPPDAAAAQAHAAGTVLAEAARRAGVLEQEKLRAAMASMETRTLLGTYRVAPSGEQTGIKPAVVQILGGRAHVMWPPALHGEARLQPYPPWNERTLIK